MTTINQHEADVWEPMETAPLDGTPVRLRKGDEEATASWSTEIGAWIFGIASEPNAMDRILPWHPTSWAPVRGALESV